MMSRTQKPWAHQSLIPLVVVDRATSMPRVADALVEGGITICEIALRTPAALEAIASVRDRGGFIVGAGTVLSIEQGQKARDAGAVFGVSPVADTEVMAWAMQTGWPFIPGAASPGEVWSAISQGFDTVKIFPASDLGGPRFIDSLSSVFPDTNFVVSGGISASDADDYLSRRSVTSVSGSWITPASTISTEGFQEISSAASSWVTRDN